MLVLSNCSVYRERHRSYVRCRCNCNCQISLSKGARQFSSGLVTSAFSLQNNIFWGAAGLGFEPRLTDPESVVLPLHQPILYEKVFQSLTNLALNPKQAGHFEYPEGFGRAGYRLEHLVSEPQIDL